MRHLGSLVLSIVLAPIIWALAGVGLIEYSQARARFGNEFNIESLLALAMLLLAGALYALLIMARFSPIGPMVAGLIYLGLVGWITVDVASFYQALPRSFFGTDFAFAIPAHGYAAVLAVPLLATAVSPRRWRRAGSAPTPQVSGPAQPGSAFSPAPAYPAPGGATEAPTAPILNKSTTATPPTTVFPSAPTFPTSAPAFPTSAPAFPRQRTAQHDDEVTESLGEQTRPLHGTPPPPAAYPPPGHAAPTASPTDPDITRPL